jgi:hypothetical protein
MGQVDFIIIIFEGHFKGQCVVAASTFALHRVLIVTDIFSVAVPAVSTRATRVFCRVEKRLLTLVVRTVGLYKIDDVKLVSDIFSGIRDFKVVPLCVSGCAVVVFQNQVVRVFSHHHHPPQIA